MNAFLSHLLRLPVSHQQATRSVNLALQPSKVQIWRASCQDPIPAELQDKVRLTLSCLGGHLQIHGDIKPSPVVLGEQASTERTTQRFQRIATTLADLSAEGPNAQSVNDLLTVYVGAASQHVLRMSFVPEQELTTSTHRSRPFGPTSSNATSPLRCFFFSPNLEDLVWAQQFTAPCCCPMAVVPTLMATTQSPDTDTLSNAAPRLRAQLAQLQTTLSPQTNKPASPQNTWRSPSPEKPLKRNKSPRSTETSTCNFLTASLTHLLNAPCSHRNPRHTPVRTSCSPAVKRMRPRIVASAFR